MKDIALDGYNFIDNIGLVGDGRVVLIAGGGKLFTDIAARFVGSEKSLDEIIASPHNKKIIQNIIDSNHLAVTEFDNFIFGIEGYSRVTETQLVRKRLASYLIKSGRVDKLGKRTYDMVVPEDILNLQVHYPIKNNKVTINIAMTLPDGTVYDIPDESLKFDISLDLDIVEIMNMIGAWYNQGIEEGYKEEDLRYLKPQATEFKAIVSMNAHALSDWFKIRTCMNAQTEIRDLACKMMHLAKNAAPELADMFGPSCYHCGYCPENKRQHKLCIGKVYTKEEALNILKEHRK